ncbi:hypothetical protein Q9X98_000636 [Vibrio parahaemolyticus]|uniref:hypothetical protein n=1 Tax=Vibrio TaxID=662 RepID=UPI0011101E59|nr:MULTISPECIES: hypothetical protein [Vibrio]EGQ9880053.1 hypothetical protein [Vibrio vulnificus]ELA7319134.1 hypothetical protein [Vibrio parahaemolyticus]MCX9439857.1 hypothetical protein [Vibrio cholerae]TMX49993.1 hypothetical protein DA091_20695 [Vibrio alginolyticus]
MQELVVVLRPIILEGIQDLAGLMPVALEAAVSKILIPMTSATVISHPPHNPKGRFSLSVRSSRERRFQGSCHHLFAY